MNSAPNKVIVPPLPMTISSIGVEVWAALCDLCSWEHQADDAGHYKTLPFAATVPQLEDRLGVGEMVINRGLDELKRYGYVVVQQVGDDDSPTSNQYILRTDYNPNRCKQLRVPFFSGTIRAMVENSGVMWFCQSDICEKIHITNSGKALDNLDMGEWKKLDWWDDWTHHRPMNFVDISGLFGLVLRAKEGPAKQFRLWVTGYLLPHVIGATSECKMEIDNKKVMQYIDSLPKYRRM